jgi:adenylate kinase family enzyme
MKIHIFGASGSGVSTLGEKLSGHLQIPYFDTDFYYWEKSDPPFTVRRNPKVRNEMIISDMRPHESWILGGSVISWGDRLFPLFDLAVFLWIPPEIRIERLKKRELERYGHVIFTDPARNQQYLDFIDWASGYDSESLAGRTIASHEKWISSIDIPVLQIRADITIEQRFRLVLDEMAKITD